MYLMHTMLALLYNYNGNILRTICFVMDFPAASKVNYSKSYDSTYTVCSHAMIVQQILEI